MTIKLNHKPPATASQTSRGTITLHGSKGVQTSETQCAAEWGNGTTQTGLLHVNSRVDYIFSCLVFNYFTWAGVAIAMTNWNKAHFTVVYILFVFLSLLNAYKEQTNGFHNMGEILLVHSVTKKTAVLWWVLQIKIFSQQWLSSYERPLLYPKK